MTFANASFNLGRSLAGEFENQAQALDQPIWFVRLRLWHRPLPHRLDGCLALFAEQANVLTLDQPYRQRIMLLQAQPMAEHLQVQYLAFKNPEHFAGAGAHPQRLQNLTLDQLEWLPDCVLTVQNQDAGFKAQMNPEARCCFQYQEQTRQVVLGFEADEQRFLSYDRGVDPETGQGLWGALMGPYEFQKIQNFADELPA
jgi:hypothetical protein